MDKTSKVIQELENNDEDLVIEVMRGDNEQSRDENAEDTDKNAHIAGIISKLSSESIMHRLMRLYRKHFKGRLLRIICVLLVLILITVLCVNLVKNKSFTVTFYQVQSDKVSDNIRVIELADLHNKQYGENNIKLINKIKTLHPDLIVYAGDMMNYKDSDYSVLFDLSDELSKIAPIYACYGNNELDQYLFEDKEFTKELEKHGVDLLSNEKTEITVGRSKIQFIAVSEGLEQYDVETNNAKKFVEKLDPTDACRICLTHYPELFKEKLIGKDIDIAFTGHAHGGLIRLPKIGGIYSNGEGFFPTLTSGVNEMEDGTQVIVSRGLGSSGFIPRINNQPELVVTDICWY